MYHNFSLNIEICKKMAQDLVSINNINTIVILENEGCDNCQWRQNETLIEKNEKLYDIQFEYVNVTSIRK